MKFKAREIESYNMELADVKKYEGKEVNAYVYKNDLSLKFPNDIKYLEFKNLNKPVIINLYNGIVTLEEYANAKHDYLVLEFNHEVKELTKMVCSMANLGVELVVTKKENEW